LKHSIRRMKVAYPLMKKDRRSFGSLPFWFGFRIGTVKAQDQGRLRAQEARSRQAWKEPTVLGFELEHSKRRIKVACPLGQKTMGFFLITSSLKRQLQRAIWIFVIPLR
jgi:hypothetical protein